ncbi:MAG: ABC transporter ATP-binding protein [Caldilineaceae bacterium]|nr:ABC transporter ATP-binding protein [Caldilineaceae bacterium]
MDEPNGPYAVELRQLTKQFPGRGGGQPVTAVDHVSLQIGQGEFFTLLGPSGCGKTTTLRMIAGFELPTAGDLLIQGRAMTNIPPNGRPVNTVFQNYALFPHMTVADNVAFGLRVKRVSKAEREQRVQEALALVQLSDLRQRRPAQLSGGQQQRVALARAIVNQPQVLLLDEPLGALDLKLRREMQLELKHLQAHLGITFIYVTHDQEEALTMSDRIAVMQQGVVQQAADPVTIYEHPVNRFVADFIGESNFLAARVAATTNGRTEVDLLHGAWRLPVSLNGHGAASQPALTITVRPEKVLLAPPAELLNGAMAGSKLYCAQGVVQEAVYIGTDTRYQVALPTGESLVVRAPNMRQRGQDYKVGDTVQVAVYEEDLRPLWG